MCIYLDGAGDLTYDRINNNNWALTISLPIMNSG